MAEVTFDSFPGGWTARDIVGDGRGYLYGRTRNIDLRGVEAYPSRGFKVVRKIAASVSAKPGSSWAHVDEAGRVWPWYYCNDSLYPETGSDSPSNIATPITETWTFSAFNMESPCGISGFFPGTNAEAYLIRTDDPSSPTALEAVAWDFAQANQPSGAANGAGGTLPTDTYYILCTWVDDAGATTIESKPSVESAGVSITLGDNLRVTRPSSPPTRATKWRIYVGTVTGGTAFYYQAEVAVGTTTYDITAPLDTTTLVTSLNGFYPQTTLPLDEVDICCVHLDRLVIASTDSNKIYWSERDDPQSFYTTSTLGVSAGAGWNAPIRGMISVGNVLYVFTTNSVHRVYGDFSRDVEGDNPTYAARVDSDTIAVGIGAVSHRAITDVGSGRIFFMSTEGPAMLAGNTVAALGHTDIRDEFPRWDWDYMVRSSSAFDRESGCWCLSVPCEVSSQRPQDGASATGFPHLIYRHDGQRWFPPLSVDTVDLAVRPHTTSEGTVDAPTELVFVGPHGTLGQLNFGWSGGDADGDVSASDFDGKLATASTTTSATVTLSGISDNALVGQLVLLRYPDDDTGFPAEVAVKTIVSNTTSGSSLTIGWVGALTAPSGTEWTVRIAGWPHEADLRFFPGGDIMDIVDVEFIHRDVVGAESRA